MLDGDEAATDTAVSQFRNSSPILMRPVYFPAILSPCYGLPLCNYILIPPAARRISSRFAPHSLVISYRPRLIQLWISSLHLLVIVINLCVYPPVVFLSLAPSRMYASIW